MTLNCRFSGRCQVIVSSYHGVKDSIDLSEDGGADAFDTSQNGRRSIAGSIMHSFKLRINANICASSCIICKGIGISGISVSSINAFDEELKNILL